MSVFVQVFRSGGSELVVLSADRASVGTAPTNDIVVTSDRTVSRLHAVIERFPGGWSVRDLGSRNGTFVNGTRVLSDCALRTGDEIRVGSTRLAFRSDEGVGDPLTEVADSPPTPTPRERDVLVALCAPVFSGELFTEPASIKEIAAALVVSEAAVKQHMLNLYDKFGLHTGNRRVLLANEAIRRGVVTLADLRAGAGGQENR
jgi:hypothetical protein